MRLIFKELYIFAPSEKKAKRIEFTDGINVITSSQEDGTDRGKSVIMRSLYHAMGAEGCFEKNWESKNKVYVLKVAIDGKGFYIYRSAELFKFFNEDKQFYAGYCCHAKSVTKDITVIVNINRSCENEACRKNE